MNIRLIMMMESVRSFFKREEGASAIEYALIAGIMAAVVLAGVQILGDGVLELFGDIAEILTKSTEEFTPSSP